MRVLRLVLLCVGLAAAASTSQRSTKEGQLLGHMGYQRPPPEKNTLQGVAATPKMEWFNDQLLDHFDPSSNATWDQRYFSNPALYQEGGPVFIYIEGESTADPGMITEGGSYMAELAKTFKAKLYSLEHRFFGKSQPTSDIETSNLRWLSADQALADLAYFIEYLIEKGEIEEDQKVAVFGGFYAGNLAAWARLKYPHLIGAAVASSAPLRAEENFKGYMEVVTSSIKKLGGQVCANNLEKAFNRIKKLLMTTDGIQTIQDLFYMCEPLDVNNPLDVDYFYEVLANPFALAAQYNHDGSFTYNVKEQCEMMGGWDVTEDDAVSNLANVFYASVDTLYIYCFDWTYADNTADTRSTSYRDGSRQWLYMTCALFGYFPTTDGDTVFPKGAFGVDLFLQQCKDAFGEEFDDATVKRGVKRTNTVFGDWNPDVENVIFINGEIDPWHRLGVVKDLNEKSPAILLSSTSHCSDMKVEKESDPKELRDARQKIKDFLTGALYNSAVAPNPTLGTNDD